MKVVKASLDFRDLNLDTDQVFPRLEARIASVKEITLNPSKYFYFRNRAVSALEIHGPNDNGDAFEESELIKSYASFINSRESIDHNGDDVVGIVLDSAWIPFKGVFRPGIGIISTNLLDYKQGDQLIGGWVENIHAMDREVAEERHPGIIQAMLNGEITDTSMGCYCQSAICSICGNEATTEREYCEHIAYKGRKIAVAGEEKPVFEKNRGIVFFEDSIILPFALGGTAGGQGADPKAKQLQVFCSTHQTSLKQYIVNRPLQALAGESYYKVGDKPESYDKNKDRLDEDHKKRVDEVLNRTKEGRQEAQEAFEKDDEKFQDKVEAEKKEATMKPHAWPESEIKKLYKERVMKRQAGTMELPNTQAKANKFVELYNSIDPGKTYGYEDMQGIMSRLQDVAFDDEMLDTIGDWVDPDEEKDNTIKGSKIQTAMRKFAREIVDLFEEEGQEAFKIPMDPTAILILKSLGSAVVASRNKEEKEAKAGIVTAGTRWSDIGIKSDIPDFEGFTAVYNQTGERFSVSGVDDKGLTVDSPITPKKYAGVSDVHKGRIYAWAFSEGIWSLLTPEGKKVKFLGEGEVFYTGASKKEDPKKGEKPEPKKEEKTPSEKAFDYILKTILPKKDGGEGKSFSDAQKEAMKLFGEEIKQEKFDQMKQEREMKDKKKGGEDMKRGKEASLEIEAQKARMQEKLAGFFDGKPLGQAQEENIFDGKPKGSDNPENPFTGQDIPGGRGPKRDPYTGKPTAGEEKELDPFKGKEAPGERGIPADDLFKGKDLPGGAKGQVNIFKELTSTRKELSLAKLRISTLERRATEYQSKFSRAMKAYDIVTAMLSKGMIVQADAKNTFEDLVNSSDEQLISTEKLVAVFKPNPGPRLAGLRDVRMSRIAGQVPVEAQGAIAAPASVPESGEGVNDLDQVFMD